MYRCALSASRRYGLARASIPNANCQEIVSGHRDADVVSEPLVVGDEVVLELLSSIPGQAIQYCNCKAVAFAPKPPDFFTTGFSKDAAAGFEAM